MFTRSKSNPILKPNIENEWENFKVYNPGAHYEDGVYHLFYRAMGKNWISSIGHATSSNGENFERSKNPLLTSLDNSYSIEDPRITKIKEKYFLTFTRYDKLNVTLNLATSTDLKNWDLHGEMIPSWDFKKASGFLVNWDPAQIEAEKNPKASRKWCKAGAIFPEIVGDKYWMLFGDRHIWLANSKDGVTWDPIWEPFIKARGKNYFDEEHIEMGPPPIKTSKGWLVLYHGVSDKIVYRLGFMLLDLSDPTKILYRSSKPIFEPQEPYELKGIVDILPGGSKAMEKMNSEELTKFIQKYEEKDKMPRVAFVNGAALVLNTLHIYYGASDSVICTATVNIGDVLNLIK